VKSSPPAWVAPEPFTSAASLPPSTVYAALPKGVRRKGPASGTPEWGRRLAAGAFVDGFALWAWFATLTFRSAVTSRDQAKRYVYLWLDALAKRAGDHLRVVYTIEPHIAGTFHVHSLVELPSSGGEQMSIAEGNDLWAAGFACIRRFDPALGGAWYVTKLADEWHLTYGCPRTHACRRRGGCVFARANCLYPRP
jgi:hypothetical protein